MITMATMSGTNTVVRLYLAYQLTNFKLNQAENFSASVSL